MMRLFGSSSSSTKPPPPVNPPPSNRSPSSKQISSQTKKKKKIQQRKEHGRYIQLALSSNQQHQQHSGTPTKPVKDVREVFCDAEEEEEEEPLVSPNHVRSYSPASSKGRQKLARRSHSPSVNETGSVKSSSLFRRRGRSREKKQNDAEIDQILRTYARSRSASRTRVLVPTEDETNALHTSTSSAKTFEDKEHDSDASSSYHSGFSSSSDSSFKSAAQSTSEYSRKSARWFRRSPKPKRTGGTIISTARSEGAFFGTQRKSQKPPKAPSSGTKKKPQPVDHNNDTESRADASVRSRSSSIAHSLRRLVRRTKPQEVVPSEIGVSREGSSSIRPILSPEPPIIDDESDVAVKKYKNRRTLGRMFKGKRSSRSVGPKPRHTPQRDKPLGAPPIQSSSMGKGTMGSKVGTPDTAASSSTTGASALVAALMISAEVRKLDGETASQPDFAPRLEDPEEPLVDGQGKDCRGNASVAPEEKITLMIDPLDIEFFLKSDLGEEEGPIEEDDVSSLSLSSCSTMSSASMVSMSSSAVSASGMSLTDDYGVYRKRQSPSTASLGTMKSSRAMSILNGDFDAAASYDMPSTMNVHATRKISILLLEPVLKIFEIVSVICGSKTTLQETIEKAKAAAVDDKLSKQKYIGLCNDVRVMSNPNALVLRLAAKDELRGSLNLAMADREMKNIMEKHLLVAVPSKSTSHECQKIRRMLWKNPKLQAWWHAANRVKHTESRKPPGPRYL